MRRVLSVLLLALVVGGCSDTVGPGNIVGKWDQDFSFPGSLFEMDLTLAGSMVSGGGNWCGEAGPCGIVTVTGTVNGNAVELDLAYTAQLPAPGPTSTQHFSGRLASANSLKGSLNIGTPAVDQTVSYHRV
jgi:hypothetical protein